MYCTRVQILTGGQFSDDYIQQQRFLPVTWCKCTLKHTLNTIKILLHTLHFKKVCHSDTTANPLFTFISHLLKTLAEAKRTQAVAHLLQQGKVENKSVSLWSFSLTSSHADHRPMPVAKEPTKTISLFILCLHLLNSEIRFIFPPFPRNWKDAACFIQDVQIPGKNGSQSGSLNGIGIVRCWPITASFGDQLHLKGVTPPPPKPKNTFTSWNFAQIWPRSNNKPFIHIHFKHKAISACWMLFFGEHALFKICGDDNDKSSPETNRTGEQGPYLCWAVFQLPNKCCLLMIPGMHWAVSTATTVTSCETMNGPKNSPQHMNGPQHKKLWCKSTKLWMIPNVSSV